MSLEGTIAVQPGSVGAPFQHVLPIDEVSGEEIRGLVSSLWRIVLTALYLRVGQFIPENAKLNGGYFGYCDELGIQTPEAEATHFGWSADDGP